VIIIFSAYHTSAISTVTVNAVIHTEVSCNCI